MTTTVDPTTAAVDPITAAITAANERELPPCPPWCEVGRRPHQYDENVEDGRPVRYHETSSPVTVASTDRDLGTRKAPCVSVDVVMMEKVGLDGLEFGVPQVAVLAEWMPHLTAAEARQVAERLQAAADQIDAICAAR